MGMFADASNKDNRLSFADQGNQTSSFRLQETKKVCWFHLLFGANKQKLLFSINSVFQIYIY
jgi:hypothetical protein